MPTFAKEATIVEFRRGTLLPLDDVMGALRDTIPNLSCGALHRCLQRHDISRRPLAETNDKRKRFKTHEIGYVHINSTELRPIFNINPHHLIPGPYTYMTESAAKMVGGHPDHGKAVRHRRRRAA